MEAFEYTALPARVIFGFRNAAAGCRRIGRARLQAGFSFSPIRITRRQVRRVSWMRLQVSCPPLDRCGHAHAVGRYERVMAKLVASNADCLVSLGGGSTIGLGKALALRTDLPQIVLPPPMQARRRPRFSARPVTDKSRPSAR